MSAKCGLSRLNRLSACSSAFTETRVSIEPEASSCENRGMSGNRIYVFDPRPEADVLSITTRNDSLRASAISVGFVGFDPPRAHIDSLRVDIASAADLPRRGGNTRFRAAHILLSHAGHNQEWRDECDGKDVFDSHDFSPAFTRKYTGRLQLLLH